MPPYWQPRELQQIVYVQIAKNILSNYTLAERQSVWKSQDVPRIPYKELPLPIPSSLLKQMQILQKCSGKGEDLELTKFIFNTLMTFDTQNLVISMPPQSKAKEFSQILHVVASEGKNLRKLHFVQGDLQPDLLGNFTQSDLPTLATLLETAKNLVHLQIQYKCTDDILKIIGEECHQLRILQVPLGLISDIGIHELTQRVRYDPNSQVNNDWESQIWHIPKIFPPFARLAYKEYQKFSNHSVHLVREKNPLCDTLLELDVTGSSITHKGIFALLELIPKLETVGDLLNVGCFEKIRRIWDSHVRFLNLAKPILNIRNLICKDKPVTVQALSVLNEMCPNLTSLTCKLRPNVQLIDLQFLKKIQYLNCTKIPEPLPNNNANNENNNVHHVRSGEQEIIDYLDINGHQLKKLNLTFPEVTQINLYTVLVKCPKLEELRISIKKFIIWDGLLRHMSLWHLTKIRLFKCVTARATLILLKVIPNARELNIRCCWEQFYADIMSVGELIVNHAHLEKLVIKKKQVVPLTNCMQALLQSSNKHMRWH